MGTGSGGIQLRKWQQDGGVRFYSGISGKGLVLSA